MRSIKLPIAAVLALTLLAVAARAADPSKQIADFLGEAAVAILKAPEKVECFRIDGKNKRTPEQQARIEETTKRIQGYAIIAQDKDQDAAFGAKLAAVLLDEKTYDFDSAKLCAPVPGVAFRIWKGEASIDVVLCFECDELDVVTAVKGKDARHAREDFDNTHAALAALAKAAFPSDKLIQAMK